MRNQFTKIEQDSKKYNWTESYTRKEKYNLVFSTIVDDIVNHTINRDEALDCLVYWGGEIAFEAVSKTIRQSLNKEPFSELKEYQ